MKKIFFGALLTILAMMGTMVLAAEPMIQGWGKTYSSNQIIGMRVLNQQGEELGRIQEFVIDSRGHVPFAVVSQGGMWGIGGKVVAVPYGALTFNPSGRNLVLDTTREKFLSAPAYRMKDLTNEKWVEDVYRYFGQQPYWTEGESYSGEHMGTTTEQYEYP